MMKNYLAIAALAVVLSACGGGSNNVPTAQVPVTPAVPMMDAFVASILNLIATSPDNTEPTAVDSFTVTSPENTEPASVS